MKKTIFTFLAFFAFAVNSLATPYTWVDTMNFNPDRYVGWFQSTSYTHILLDNGFSPGVDTINSYNLEIKLYDDSGRKAFGDLAFVNQPGLTGDGYYTFNYLNQSFGWSLAGLIQLNNTGKLDITVSSVYGDFYLDYSKLTAYGNDAGNDAAPVPEPGTMVLLGFGLLGLAIYSKRRMNKES